MGDPGTSLIGTSMTGHRPFSQRVMGLSGTLCKRHDLKVPAALKPA